MVAESGWPRVSFGAVRRNRDIGVRAIWAGHDAMSTGRSDPWVLRCLRITRYAAGVSDHVVCRVVVFALGGTIAMTRSAEGGVVPALSARELVGGVPGLGESGVAVEVVDFRQVSGASLGFSDITALAGAIRVLPEGVDGVVVTQGTDSIEETSYLLDLLHGGERPVVVTGAMRNPTLAGADGPANLLGAVLTAAHPEARGQGCLVVFDDEIHAARRVHKTHTAATGAFRSPDGGPLGYLVEGRPRFLNRLPHRFLVPADNIAGVRIPIHTVVLGDDGTTLHPLAGRIDGLVVAAFGAGHVPAELVPVLERLAAEVPVVLASRTGAGSVLETTYGFAGSERDLLARGLIPAGFLTPIKARILLAALLATGRDRDTLRTAITVAGGSGDPGDWPLR
ncbi:asparaginase [Nocardia terpenica]|uniref:asparaginase n=2 Tax=Nocardia terpenica TaxID=455432 RepID=UPI002B4B12C7|nr:asparaginase [Nocardia terpenica]